MDVDGIELSLSSASRYDGTDKTTRRIIESIHFNIPWILLLIFLSSFIANSILTAEPSEESIEPTLTGPGGKPLPRSARKIREARKKRERERQLRDLSPSHKLLFRWLSVGVLMTYIGNVLNVVAHALDQRNEGWWCGEATAIYFCASMCFYIVILISLIDATPSPTIAHQVTWIVALSGELVLLGASVSLYTSPHKDLDSVPGRLGGSGLSAAPWELAELIFNMVRAILLMFLVSFYFIFTLTRSHKTESPKPPCSKKPSEQTPLLAHTPANINGAVTAHGTIEIGAVDGHSTAHGSTPNGLSGHDNSLVENGLGGEPRNKGESASVETEDEVPAFYKPTSSSDKTWWEYLKGYSLFFPYLWPSKSLRLQIIVVACFILVVLQRAVNILVPIQLGAVTNKLYGKDGGIPWLSIFLLITYKFLHGPSGILGALRSVLWIPISQYSYQALTTASFEHVHGLSLDFHLSKRTGEVLSALSKGNAINNFLEQVTFQVLPMVFDLAVAIGYFGYAYDAYYALVVSIITFSYIYLTIRMARWRSEARRQMQNLGREEDAVKNDSLTSYETVKYFNAEEYEFDRYQKAVTSFQKMELKVTISLNILNMSQNLVFMAGLLTVAVIAAYQVTQGKREVGDFITLMTYMNQLQQPLNFFGSFYRGVQSAMISGERLLELFKEKPTVVNEVGARHMPSCEGEIRYQNVKFSYDRRKPALENLTFTCRPGTTTAFVGESGGGKSTIYRLLYRFYNIEDGSIQVDGNDIKDVTIESLRSHIGVVPQDTVLFNESLMYNLRYANQDATDEEIYEACKAASIHDKIRAFPDGYNTKVGERGLRLSGGEKQRVAIARTIIKNPRIIMLDEATAALDSDTEQHIQEALRMLSAGRTMLVIAHRLSTITTADQILVLHAGRVVEAGTHQKLLAQKGRYASMWKKQIRAERAAEAASQMVAKANALRDAAMKRPSSASADGGPSEDASENEGDMRSSSTLVAPSLVSHTLVRSAQTHPDHCSSTAGTINYDSSDEPKSDEGKSNDGDSYDARAEYARSLEIRSNDGD